MGQSTDAILFFGFCWDEETNRPWEIGKDTAVVFNDDSDDGDDDRNDNGWEHRYARLSGLKEPSRPYPDRAVPATRANGWSTTPQDYSPEEQEIIAEHLASWEARRALIAKLPVKIDTHCSAEVPMPFVAIKASEVRTSRGDTNEITSLEVKPEWEGELRTFCEFMGIDVSAKKAAWWLVSDWH